MVLGATATAQRGRFYFRLPPNPRYDGAFRYCRGIYQRNPVGDGGGWTTDYPQADLNLSFRLSELAGPGYAFGINAILYALTH